uniref:Uncharacterized protein n=1 Tax=Haptolina brevifila TaxID=156173 RepID=A0A7S2DK13_9EUKA
MGRIRTASVETYKKAIDLRDQGLEKIGVRKEELKKLDGIELMCAFVSLIINLLLLGAMANFAWIKGTALSGGQPFKAFLSLTDAQFGTPEHPTVDNKYFCDARHSCSLSALCKLEADASLFPNGLPMSTPSGSWCAAARAGAMAASLLWFGLIPGLAATAFTAMYACKDIALMLPLVEKVDAFNMSIKIQKMIISACWAALWLFMFVSMIIYAAMMPDTLGWGSVQLEASFGLLRLSFVLVSIFGAILISHFFDIWKSENVAEVWQEFTEARMMSAKKALYIELMFQLLLYLFLVVDTVDWSALLIVLAAFYLDAKNKNFLLMYLVLVTISLLFDIIHAAELPSFSQMTPGESFGATLWIMIFLMKPIILATIFAYEKYETASEQGGYNNFHEPGFGMGDDQIAE